MPKRQLGGCGGTLQQFHIKGIGSVVDIGGKFTHLVGFAAVSVLESHSEHFVGVERRSERNVAQRCVDRIFRRTEQSRLFNFFIILTTFNAVSLQRFQSGRSEADIASIGIIGFDFI